MILDQVVHPAIRGMASDGRPYRGFLYCGLMITRDGPKLLEFNCRMGDPEAQAIVMRMNLDLAEALQALESGMLQEVRAGWKPGASVCVVVASGGYPGKFETGKRIEGLEDASAVPGVVVFHAGTRAEGTSYYTCGGRVLGVSAAGRTLEAARRASYEAVRKVRFEGSHYRGDIGASPVSKTSVAGE